MNKVKEYIEKYTRKCSNELDGEPAEDAVYLPWLTPFHAECAAHIAREDAVDQVCDWLIDAFEKDEYLVDGYDFYNMIKDVREKMKGE